MYQAPEQRFRARGKKVNQYMHESLILSLYRCDFKPMFLLELECILIFSCRHRIAKWIAAAAHYSAESIMANFKENE